ncbi:MAG: amidohydrolase family protein [Planctomycetota bacterium]|nr:amidohydrolase family protein [Planctomycetota bacterium]
MAPRTARPRRPRLIDCHGHVNWYGYDARRVVANMDEHGISVMWLLTWEVPPDEVDEGSKAVLWPGQSELPFRDVAEAVARYPKRFVPFYAPDPRQRGALTRLRSAVKCFGVRGCGELKCRVMLDEPGALELFHYCGEAKLPVIFHMDVPLPRRTLGRDPGYWYCCDWENLARALELCRRTVFVGHAPGFWREISGDADASEAPYPEGPVTPGGRLWKYLDRYPNLYCDLSAGSALRALRRNPAIARRFLNTYHTRCLFGRDYFDDALYKFLKSCSLRPRSWDCITRANALRLVPL